MKKLLFIAFVGLLLVGCNKNQKAVKTLDGKWKATSFVITDGSVSLDLLLFGVSFEMDFENCKLKNDETCDISLTVTDLDGSEVENGKYKVTDDGERLEVIDNTNTTTTYTIKELTKTDLELTGKEDGLDATIKLVKQ